MARGNPSDPSWLSVVNLPSLDRFAWALPWSDRGGFSMWLRDLGGAGPLSGCYMIRESGRGGALRYVGESHTGRLYGTLTRHLQRWEGRTAFTASKAGVWYAHGSVVCWAAVASPDDALDMEAYLIGRFQPLDNGVEYSDAIAVDGLGDVVVEGVPF